MRALLLTSALVLALVGCAPEGPSAFVDVNLAVSDDCEVTLEGDTEYLSRGLYDAAADANTGTEYCRNDYNGVLRINSLLRTNADIMQGRAEPNILQVSRVEVTLKTQGGEVISFVDGSTPLPNPFSQVLNVSLFPGDGTNASIASLNVSMIPASYDAFLRRLAGDTIVAEVQLFGTTTGDVDVDFKPFSFPIEICDGCLTGCAMGFALDPEGRSSALEGICDDDSGQDGRVCFDPGC